MWLGTGVRVDVVLQRGQCLEASLAHGALVHPLLAVRLHVALQIVPFHTAVIAFVAPEIKICHMKQFCFQKLKDGVNAPSIHHIQGWGVSAIQ